MDIEGLVFNNANLPHLDPSQGQMIWPFVAGIVASIIYAAFLMIKRHKTH